LLNPARLRDGMPQMRFAKFSHQNRSFQPSIPTLDQVKYNIIWEKHQSAHIRHRRIGMEYLYVVPALPAQFGALASANATESLERPRRSYQVKYKVAMMVVVRNRKPNSNILASKGLTAGSPSIMLSMST
jgi:hypothetical protein